MIAAGIAVVAVSFIPHGTDNAGTSLCYNWRQNCWDIILEWGSFGERNNLHSSPPFKVGFLLFLLGSSSKHSFAWGSEKGKLYFPLYLFSHGLFLLCVGFPRLYCWAGSAWHSGQTVYHHFVWRCGPFSGGTLSNSRAVRFCYFNTCTGDLLHIKILQPLPRPRQFLVCLFALTFLSVPRNKPGEPHTSLIFALGLLNKPFTTVYILKAISKHVNNNWKKYFKKIYIDNRLGKENQTE